MTEICPRRASADKSRIRTQSAWTSNLPFIKVEQNLTLQLLEKVVQNLTLEKVAQNKTPTKRDLQEGSTKLTLGSLKKNDYKNYNKMITNISNGYSTTKRKT